MPDRVIHFFFPWHRAACEFSFLGSLLILSSSWSALISLMISSSARSLNTNFMLIVPTWVSRLDFLIFSPFKIFIRVFTGMWDLRCPEPNPATPKYAFPLLLLESKWQLHSFNCSAPNWKVLLDASLKATSNPLSSLAGFPFSREPASGHCPPSTRSYLLRAHHLLPPRSLPPNWYPYFLSCPPVVCFPTSSQRDHLKNQVTSGFCSKTSLGFPPHLKKKPKF